MNDVKRTDVLSYMRSITPNYETERIDNNTDHDENDLTQEEYNIAI